MWYAKHMCDWLLLKVAAAICSFCPHGFSGLNCEGPPGCWQSLYLSADSILHSQTSFAWHQTDAFALSTWCVITWLKQNLHLKSWNLRNNNGNWSGRLASHNSGAETSETEMRRSERNLQCLNKQTWKCVHSHGQLRCLHQQNSPQMWKKEYIALYVNRSRGKTAEASLSIPFKGRPGGSDSGRTGWGSLQSKLRTWKSARTSKQRLMCLKYAVY